MTIDHDLLDKTLDKIETLEAFKKEGVFLEVGWHQGDWGIDWEVMVERAKGWIEESKQKLAACPAESWKSNGYKHSLAENESILQLYKDKLHSCKTAFCYAGHIAADDPDVEFLENENGEHIYITVIDKDGKQWSTADWAQVRLGVSDDTADALFDASNGLATLRSLIAGIHRRDGK